MTNTNYIRQKSMRAIWGIAIIAMVVGSFISAIQVDAAGSWEAMTVSMSGSGTLTMAPGERAEVTVEFLNTGTRTWYNDGAGYVSAYTYGPKYRRTVFDPGTWLWGDHLKRIREASVAPGETASIAFELHAPTTEGYYEETFHLASEDTAWISGGEFTFKIEVTDDAPAVETIVESDDSDDTLGYGAEIGVRSANKIKAIAERTISFTVGFNNTGTKTWSSYGLEAPDVMIASASAADFVHPSWNGSRLAYSDNASVRPGEMAVISFAMKAPSTNGTHMARFQLTANGVDVPDAVLEIPVEVTGGSAAAVASEERDDVVIADLIDEPILRVGLIIVDEETDDRVVITSDESDFALRDIQGNLLGEFEVGDEVTAYYLDGYYYFDRGRGVEKSTYALRFEPVEEYAVMKIANFDRRVTRNAAYADNEFRGVLELRYNDYKDRAWVIEEVPIEMYLRGLAETSNVSPLEFQKSLITAARTYAFYHWTRNTKRVREFMHVTSYSEDQVYRGYGQEKRAPKITQAVEETYGEVVTYDGELAITPYFSRSDGRTRDWSEVWYGTVAWLKGVDVPCDAGKTMWGHGVGMSAQGALCMANEGMEWEEILKFFYTGIDLEQRWEK
ncbi:MAG: SpoIID/LytB domain-containing protein [bacterium]